MSDEPTKTKQSNESYLQDLKMVILEMEGADIEVIRDLISRLESEISARKKAFHAGYVLACTMDEDTTDEQAEAYFDEHWMGWHGEILAAIKRADEAESRVRELEAVAEGGWIQQQAYVVKKARGERDALQRRVDRLREGLEGIIKKAQVVNCMSCMSGEPEARLLLKKDDSAKEAADG